MLKTSSHHVLLAISLPREIKAALIPPATESGLPTAQKCIKNRRGCSVSMWRCNAVELGFDVLQAQNDRVYSFRRQDEIAGSRHLAGAGILEIDGPSHSLRSRERHSMIRNRIAPGDAEGQHTASKTAFVAYTILYRLDECWRLTCRSRRSRLIRVASWTPPTLRGVTERCAVASPCASCNACTEQKVFSS